MTTTASPITDILDTADLFEVAYRRSDLEGGLGQIWDITLPDEETTIRICDDDGQINVIAFTHGRAQLIDGEQTFSHALAAPTFVAAALMEIVAYYS